MLLLFSPIEKTTAQTNNFNLYVWEYNVQMCSCENKSINRKCKVFALWGQSLCILYQSTWATIKDHHGLGGLNNRNVFSQFSILEVQDKGAIKTDFQ